MSQENVEIVRRAWEAYSVGGIEALLPLYRPDVRIYPTPEFLEEPIYEGHDGLRRLAAGFTDNFDNWGWELHELREAGSRVLALAEMTGQIKDSRVPMREPWGVVFSDFRDGMIGEVRYFRSQEQALKAVGLSE
jgi:ketosteroid isomerase-like protein